jgi:hypothetical protein
MSAVHSGFRQLEPPVSLFCIAMQCANSTLHPAVHEAWRNRRAAPAISISALPGSTLDLLTGCFSQS